MTSVNKTLLANVFCTVTFYSYGTAMMDYFLVYPSRVVVGADEFVTYHALLEARILPISVLPFLLLTLLNILLLWQRPASVPKSLIWLSLVCLLLDWTSSVFIQIPMNLQLNEGKNLVLVQKVMDTNYGRIFLESAQAVLAFIILYKQAIYNDTHRLANQPADAHTR